MENAIEFFKWCNTPIYRASGELGFKLIVQPQYPEYNTYIVLDEDGYSVFKDNLLSAEQLYEYWVEITNKPKQLYWFNDKKQWDTEVAKLSVSDDTIYWSKDDQGKLNSMWYEDRGEGWIKK